MVKKLLLCGLLALPVIAAFIPATRLPITTAECAITMMQVREEPNQTVISSGRWSLISSAGNSHGYYNGKVRFYNAQAEKVREVRVDRNLSLNYQLHDRFLETTTRIAAPISGDRLDDRLISQYVSPVLVEGHTGLSMLFITPGGHLLSGLNSRPRVKCDTDPSPLLP